MPLVSISFSADTRIDLDKLVTQFFIKESIRPDNLKACHFSYYNAYTCQIVFWSAVDVDLEDLHNRYSYDPMQGLAYEQHRDQMREEEEGGEGI